MTTLNFSRIILCTISLYASLITSYKFIFTEKFHDFFSCIFFFSMLFVGWFSYKFGFYVLEEIYEKSLGQFKINNKSFPLILLFSIFFTFSSRSVYIENSKRSIWLDEYTQFKKVTDDLLVKNNIVNVAASEQQPPLDYFFSSSAFSFLGWSPLAVRIHAVVFYFILFALIFLYTWEKYRSLVTQSIIMMIFVSTPLFRYYAIEGRPTMLASLSIFFYYIEVETFFQEQKKTFCPFLFLATFIAAMAIGIQTQLIVFIYSIIIYLTIFKKNRESSTKFLITHLAVLFACLPVLILMYNHSNQSHQFVSAQNIWNVVLSKVNLLDFFNIVSYNITSSNFEYVFWILLLIASFKTIFSKYSPVKSLGYFFLFFPIALYFIFISIINWPFTRKYYISFLIFLLPLWMYVLHSLSKNLKARHIRVALVLISLTVTFGLSRNSKSILSHIEIESHTYTKELYQSLIDPKFTNYSISFNLPVLGQWRGSEWINREFYGGEDTYFHNPEEKKLIHNLHISWNKIPNDKPIKVHLVINTTKSLYRHSILTHVNELLPQHEIKKFGKQTVVSVVWNPKEAPERWESFLSQLEERLPPDYKYIFHEKKLAQAILENRYNDCLRLNGELLSLKVPAKSDGGLAIDSSVELKKNAEKFNCGLVEVHPKELYESFVNPDYTNYAINFNLPVLGQWRGGEWFYHELYAKKEFHLHNLNEKHLIHHFHINWKHFPKDKPIMVHLVINMSKSLYSHTIIPFINELLPNHSIKNVGRQSIVTFILSPKDAQQKWDAFFEKLKEKLPPDYLYLFHEKKLAEAIIEDKYDDCVKLNNELLKLNVPAVTQGGLSINVKAELEKSARIFHCGLVPLSKFQ
jgi:hypothetical protein